jgi:hypothetical protein
MARETITRGHSVPPRHEAPTTWTRLARLRPTTRGVWVALVALALVAVELVTGDEALWLVLVVVALPWVVAPVVVLRRAAAATAADIHLIVAPPLVPVGAASELLVQLVHPTGVALPPLGLDRPSEHWSAVGAHTAVAMTSTPSIPAPALAPDSARLIRWDRTCADVHTSIAVPMPTRRRGVFRIGPLRLWAHDPFALFGLTVAIAKPALLVVHPVAVSGVTEPAARPGTSGSSQFSDGPPGVHTDDPGGEWSGLRPYEPGDRLHLLSWQAEARSGALLVHDFRPDSEEVLVIVFDDRAGVHRRHAFERGLGVVHGLVAAVSGGATDYDLQTLSGRRIRGSTTPDGLVALLTFLAEVQPTRAHRGGASAASALSAGALLLTTPTAVGSLPASVDPRSVVVVE